MTALLEHGIDQDRLIRMAGPHGLLAAMAHADAEGVPARVARGVVEDCLVGRAGPQVVLPLFFWLVGAIGPGVVSRAMLSRLRELFETNARQLEEHTCELRGGG